MSKEYLNRKWDPRLENWAVYVTGQDGGSNCKISSAYSLAGHGTRAAGDVIPVILGEAMDTDHLVRQLEPKLQKALIAGYVKSGTIGQRAAELGCHANTLTIWIDIAKQQLDRLERFRIKRAHAPGETV